MGKSRILIVDDEESVIASLEPLLREAGFEVVCTTDGYEALTLIYTAAPALVLLDIWLPGMDGMETLQALKGMRSDTEVVVMSGHGNIEAAMQAIKLGAFDYIEKPFSAENVLSIVRRAFAHRAEGDSTKPPQVPRHELPMFLGHSPQINAIRRHVSHAWASNETVVIQGEPGSGKALLARILHNGSARQHGPFVHCDCTNLSPHAAAGILFGCTGGLYGWSNTLAKGYLELANGGSVFLDRIDCLPSEVQYQLAHVLEAGALQRVGGKTLLPLDVRFMASCTVPPDHAPAEGGLLPDLANQLRGLAFSIPPLRERTMDIPVLTWHFLRIIAYENGTPTATIDNEALACLARYDWPGNVTELRQVVTRLVMMASTHRLRVQDVARALPQSSRAWASLGTTGVTWTHGNPVGEPTMPASRPARASSGMAPHGTRQDSQKNGTPTPSQGFDVPYQQRTLRRSVVLYGQGLQSGRKTGVILSALPPGSGIVFGDITTGATLPALTCAVESTDFCTSLRHGNMAAKTIEHLMSALHAYGITNLLIKISDEIPIMDGSAAAFCRLIEEAGIVDQGVAAEEFIIDQCYHIGTIRQDAKFILVEPYSGLRVTYRMDYPPPLGVQEFTYEHIDGETYRHEIAPARTFGFVKDVEQMHALGLLAGGRLNNVILLDEDKILNHTQLRFPDECVRHKVLDIMGDLHLLGKRLRGRVYANMTGHTENVALVRQLSHVLSQS